MAQDSEPRDNATSESGAKEASVSGSLRGAFPGRFRPTSEEFDRMWEDGMFVLDTNVLLNLYRYSYPTRNELLKVLHALEDKLFLPHQVGQESLDRRLATIRKQREGFARLRERVTGVRKEMESELRKVLRLRPGEDLPEQLREALKEVPSGGYEELSARLQALESDLPRTSTSPDDDEVWTAVERLVDGKVGPPYQHKHLHEAEEEAKRRRGAKIPPGFKDERPGDYVLWRQTIDEAKRSGKPVVLVTDDRKEDWWWIEHGETIGPHYELVAEMRKEARVPFYMYTPDRLMREARERLDVEVSDESISEAEGLGQDVGDIATSTSAMWLDIEDAVDAIERLTDYERIALRRAFLVQDRDTTSIADELGISPDAASRLLKAAWDKVQDAVGERAPHRTWTEHEQQNVRRFVGRQNYPVRRAELFADRFLVTLKGTESAIIAFNNTLLSNYPPLQTIAPTFADSALGTSTLDLTFRPAVPVDFATSALDGAARETGVTLMGVEYSPSHIE